jgi:hypothetical protein
MSPIREGGRRADAQRPRQRQGPADPPPEVVIAVRWIAPQARRAQLETIDALNKSARKATLTRAAAGVSRSDLGETTAARRRLRLTFVSGQQEWKPLTREEFRALKRDERVCDREGREWGVRADAWYDADLGEYRVNLFDGAVVLIEKERFHDSYRLVSAPA